MKPGCIVLDEPTAMLDPTGRREVIKTIRSLNKLENVSVVLITHYMEEAAKADRVIVMADGKIVMDDKPKKVFSRVEELKKLGLSVPQSTELIYILNKSGIKLDNEVLTIEECVEEILKLV